MLPRSTSLRAALGLALLAAPLHAQAVGQGFELERQGQLARAADIYFAGVRATPTYLPALLGLERVLTQLQRLPELLPLARQAIAADPANPAFRALELRVFAGLAAFDSLEAAGRAWIDRSPGDETPYREWARALEGARLPSESQRILLTGRQRLGRLEALAADLAGLAARRGDWDQAAAEWVGHAAAQPAQFGLAAGALGAAPAAAREPIIGRLTREGAAAGPRGMVARRLAAEVLLVWGSPLRAWDLFVGGLPDNVNEAAQALRRFADRAGAVASREGQAARARALERLAGLVQPAQAGPFFLDAARAYVAAGDHVSARRVLERVAGGGEGSPQLGAQAEATVIAVMIEEGAVDEAAARFLAHRDDLLGDDVTHLSEQLAWALVKRRALARADSLFAQDSSVQGLAMRGWIALYRGDLKRATEYFLTAGPYSGERAAITDRTTMLALMQQIATDSQPQLGEALLLLRQGDSTGAIAGLKAAAARLPVGGGRLDVLVLVGRLLRARGDGAGAEEVLAGVVRETGNGNRETAAQPAAELELARLLLDQGRQTEAVAHLEHLILTYPTSAVVPQARRELERARGTVPRS